MDGTTLPAADTARDEADDLGAAVLEQADRLFAQHVTRPVLAEADRGAFAQAVWQAVEEAGLPSALVPDALGGSGLDWRTGMLLVRRAAYANLPVPLAEAMAARAQWARVADTHDEGLLTLAGCDRRDTARLVPDGAGWRLEGTLHRVPWSRVADAVLLVAEGPDGARYWVRAPADAFAAVAERSNLANEPRDTIAFAGVALPGSAVVPAAPGHSLLLLGATLRVHQMVGAMQRALDSAVEYAAVRVQFGRAISKFQAVQQMLAEAAGHLAAAIAAADGTLDAADADWPLAVAMAKARVGEAAGRVAGATHQVHAAMGFTQEHHLHFSTRHLWSWRDEFGPEPFWQREIGRFVCGRGGEALWPLLTDREGAAAFSARPA